MMRRRPLRSTPVGSRPPRTAKPPAPSPPQPAASPAPLPSPPPPGNLLLVAALAGAQGLGGEVRLVPMTRGMDEAARLLEAASAVTLVHAHGHLELPVDYVRDHGRRMVIKFLGVDSRTELELQVPPGAQVYVAAESARDALDDGEFLVDDLIGCQVFDAEGRRAGVVRDVQLGPQDLLVIEPDAAWLTARAADAGQDALPAPALDVPAPPTPSRTFLVPFVEPLLQEVALAERRIRIDIAPGLEDL